MNEETMRKHYEKTPKETLINILISSREQVEKLQNRNKECKQEIERLNKERNKTYENGLNYFLELQEKKEEIERLNNIINELEKYVIDREERSWDDNGAYDDVLDKLQELKGSDKE